MFYDSMWDALEKAEEAADSKQKRRRITTTNTQPTHHEGEKWLIDKSSTRIPKLSATTRALWRAKLFEALQDNEIPMYVTGRDYYYDNVVCEL